jgi:ParB family chromosome partitioning protein
MKHTHTQPSAKSETNYLARGEIQQVQLIPLKDIVSSETNPREKETPEELAELMASIKEKGLIQPITVRAFGDKGQYEVVAGHRRLWAHRELKASEIRAFVVELADSEAAEFQLVENLQRADIHPLREAEALKALEKNISFKIIAERIGKPESYIAQRLQLLSLNKESRKLYLEKVLTTPHALLLAKWTADDQLKALDFLFDGDWKRTKPDNLIARDVKELKVWIEMEIEMHLTQAPWDKNDAELIPGVPACLACPKNSGYNTALFPELNKKHVCNDRACFHAKMQAYFKQTRHASKKEEQKDFILLSENYGMNTSDPMYVKGAVKMNGRYVELKDEKKTCEHTKKGQYIDGPKKGKFVLVCNYSKCAKHWKVSERQSSSGDNYNSPANVAKREAAKK